jgi:hypothetical protein
VDPVSAQKKLLQLLLCICGLNPNNGLYVLALLEEYDDDGAGDKTGK